MIQLKILSGKMAGTDRVARHFPFQIGRSPAADLQLEEDGVWDQHVELAFDAAKGFVLSTHSNALATINGQAFHQIVLHNGDALEIGALKICFWLGEIRQTSLRLREWLTWAALALITAAQVVLVYRLSP